MSCMPFRKIIFNVKRKKEQYFHAECLSEIWIMCPNNSIVYI